MNKKLPDNWTPVFWGATTKKTSTVDNSDQARYERAVQSGNTVLANNLAKKLGISTSGGSSTTGGGATTQNNVNPDITNFEAGWGAYTKAKTDVYDIQTGRDIAKYQQWREDYQKSLQRNREDYAKYTSEAQSQMNRQLSQNSKEFARTLAKAASGFGQRGILRGGIATSQIGDATTWFVDNQTYFKTQSQRQIADQQQAYDRQYADTTTSMNRLENEKSIYASDRQVWRQVLQNDMQYQGDSLYNASQAEQWQTQQTVLRQAAKNQLYGVQSNPTKRTWRLGGAYSS